MSALVGEYGLERHGNPDAPEDDLVYLVLSNRTPPERARRVYAAVKGRYPTWSAFVAAPDAEVEDVIRPAGFARRRTAELKGALGVLLGSSPGGVRERLAQLSDDDLLDALKALPGVSDKVARCVAAYTLGREVLAVDVHVHRVASRLGWTTAQRPEQAHASLEGVVPPALRHPFHVVAISHGRARCVATRPRCSGCPIWAWCVAPEKGPFLAEVGAAGP